MSTKTLTRHTPPSRRAVQANVLWWFMCIIFPGLSLFLINIEVHSYIRLGALAIWLVCFIVSLVIVVQDFRTKARRITRFETFVLYSALPAMVIGLSLIALFPPSMGPFGLALMLAWFVCFALSVLLGLSRIR